MQSDVKIIKKDVKNITLKVRPNGEAILTAPNSASDEHIKFIMQKRVQWIAQKRAFFASFKMPQKEYVSGEDFRYLGRSYRLKVVQSKEERVKLQRDYLELFGNKIVKQDIKSVKIRQMKTRWGSCNPYKSYINLNIELIKKPKSCIEYVVFHELVHLLYPDHSKKFYDYLTLYMPDWQKRKEILEKAMP